MARMIPADLRLPEALIEKLEALAQASGISRAAVIRTLLSAAVTEETSNLG